jgi:hypothetical protein
MRIRSDLRAGDALSECQKQRDYWKAQALRMEQIAKAPTPKPTPTPPTRPPYGGGYVGGVFFPDRSGWCG